MEKMKKAEEKTKQTEKIIDTEMLYKRYGELMIQAEIIEGNIRNVKQLIQKSLNKS